MKPQKYHISTTNSWEELGEAGEQKVLTAVPKGFFYFRNILVPCIHGNDYEEIDLAVVGPTGIWSIEVKNWRGIAYPGNYPEELIFVRKTSDGTRTSTRDNPFYQAHHHSEDLHDYLAKRLKGWFPSIQTLVIFAFRDPEGINGANLTRIRYTNPSIIYLEEMGNLLEDSRKKVQAWKGWYEVRGALSKLRTWDVIHFTNGERKRGLLCSWEGYDRFKIRDGAQTILIDWRGIERSNIYPNCAVVRDIVFPIFERIPCLLSVC